MTDQTSITHKDLLISKIQKNYPDIDSSVTLSPVVHSSVFANSKWDISKLEIDKSLSSEISRACSPADVLLETGYSACSSKEDFKKFLSQFEELTERDVARMIGTLVQTNFVIEPNSRISFPLNSASSYSQSVKNDASLTEFLKDDDQRKSDSVSEENLEHAPNNWDIDVFISTIIENNPNLDWKIVCDEFDYPEFYVPNKAALIMLTNIRLKMPKGAPSLTDMLFRE